MGGGAGGGENTKEMDRKTEGMAAEGVVVVVVLIGDPQSIGRTCALSNRCGWTGGAGERREFHRNSIQKESSGEERPKKK